MKLSSVGKHASGGVAADRPEVPELIFADPEQEAESLLQQFREGLAVSDSLKLIKDYQDIGVEIRKRSDAWERR